jgi:hypothetical protein
MLLPVASSRKPNISSKSKQSLKALIQLIRTGIEAVALCSLHWSEENSRIRRIFEDLMS